MSAKHGLTFRLIGCLMAVALLGSALFASTASAKKPEPKNPTVYINLGDSVSYGYTQQKFEENFPAEPPAAFEGGYPNLIAAKLVKKEASAGNKLALANLACPGEASKGLIGNGALATELISKSAETHFTEGEAPCGWHNAAGFPRHVEYGAVSQMEAALGMVKAQAEKTGPEIKDITLQIGSNDELHKLAECANEAYLKAHSFTSFIECVQVEAKNTLFPAIINNVGLDVSVLRKAGYTGPIAILGFYNPQAFLVSGSDGLQNALNESFEKVVKTEKLFGEKVAFANPFKKTNPQGKKTMTPKEKKVLERNAICLYTEECNKFDRKNNYEKATKKAFTEAEFAVIEKETEEKFEKEEPGGSFLPGDIHPTKAGDELFAKVLGSALKKA